MDNWSTMESYLIQIGADIDQNSFNSAKSALSELKAHLMKLKGSAAPLALAAAIGAIGKAAYDTIKGVAQADMEYKKLAASMWTTKETAKALSVAMKTMGVSQDDIAWVPELRQQFFRLRAEMQKFATPADADAQLRYIREIGYDVQALFVRLKMLKEWIAYYLIQYLEPYIKEFKAFINWLLEKVGTDMPGLARKVARAMSTVLSPALATLKALGMVIGKVYDFIASLPDNVKKWGAVFAAVGAVIMAGPFGRMLMALSAAMLLIEDFMFYLNGWNSSKTLAPVWEALINFSNGTGSEWLTSFKNVLSEIAKILDDIFTGLDLNGLLKTAGENANKLWTGVSNLAKSLKKMFDDMDKGKPKVKDFWTVFGKAIGDVLRFMFRLIGSLGDVMDAVSSYLDGDRKAGLNKMRRAWGTLTGEGTASQFEGVGKDAIERSQAMVANPTSDLLGNPNGCTYFVQNAVGSNDEFISSMKGDLYVPHWVSKAREQGRYNPGTEGMKAGDIVVVSYGKPGGFGDHVVVYDGKGGYYGNSTSKERPVHGDLQKDFGDAVAGYIRPGKNKYDVDLSIKPKEKPKVNSDVTGKIAGKMLSGIVLESGFMAGSNEMAEAPFRNSYGFDFLHGRPLSPAAVGGGIGGGFGGGISLGAPTVNINVNSTNASAEEIGKAAKSGVEQGMQPSAYVFQRLMRGAIK